MATIKQIDKPAITLRADRIDTDLLFLLESREGSWKSIIRLLSKRLFTRLLILKNKDHGKFYYRNKN